MHSRSEFRLSTATPDDVGVLLSLIKELRHTRGCLKQSWRQRQTFIGRSSRSRPPRRR